MCLKRQFHFNIVAEQYCRFTDDNQSLIYFDKKYKKEEKKFLTAKNQKS